MPIKTLPPIEYLRERLDYDRLSGVLTWKNRPRRHFANARSWARCNTMYAGKPAGNINKGGYRVILLDRVPYLSHRIAWKLTTGEEPPETIDHINGDRLNNRWTNLRAATQAEQVGNQRLHRSNTSGYRGVYPQGRGWVAQLGRRYLGYFDTPEEAAAAYDTAARDHFGEFYSSAR